MKLNQIGPNKTILTLNNGTQIGFSYNTPVVAVIDGMSYRTEQTFSATTSAHCTQLVDYMTGSYAGMKPQSFFDGLLR